MGPYNLEIICPPFKTVAYQQERERCDKNITLETTDASLQVVSIFSGRPMLLKLAPCRVPQDSGLMPKKRLCRRGRSC
jgi:hypothetical protein